jgi:hypothetical protein
VERAAPADIADIADIAVSPSGFGLHFRKLDAYLYLRALLQGAFGSKAWMAAQPGAAGGRARSRAKIVAARRNGKRGGGPRKAAAR